MNDADRLRLLLGEPIPEGGADTDTMFRDEVIADILDRYPGNMDLAALEGWRIMSAAYSKLVDVTEGNAQQKMSQLREHADEQVKRYQRSSTGPTEGRTRIGRVRRISLDEEPV